MANSLLIWDIPYLFGNKHRYPSRQMRSYQYQFKTVIERIKYGRMFYGGVFLPETILSTLPKARVRGFRIIGEAGGLFSEFGVMAVKTRRYVVLSRGFLAQARLKTGDPVMFRFSPTDPNHLDTPVELEEALQSNPAASILWSNLTLGKKREYSTRVASGAQEATRLRRAYRITEELTTRPKQHSNALAQ